MPSDDGDGSGDDIDGTTSDVGVGPWEGPWPDDPHFDPDLLTNGDRRNVIDRYRYWSNDAIVADLDTRRHPFHVAIENFQHDRNIGTVGQTKVEPPGGDGHRPLRPPPPPPRHGVARPLGR
jgi:hypothetical protein